MRQCIAHPVNPTTLPGSVELNRPGFAGGPNS
jgi:hypothetical protein